MQKVGVELDAVSAKLENVDAKLDRIIELLHELARNVGLRPAHWWKPDDLS